MRYAKIKKDYVFWVGNKYVLPHPLIAGISLLFALLFSLLPSVSMGVVINQNAASGQGAMPSYQNPNATTFPNQKNAPGQLKMPGQKNGKGQDQLPQYIPGEVLVKFKQGVDDGKKKYIHDKMDAEVLSEIRKIGVHKVKSKRGLSTEELIRQYKNDPDVLFAEPNGIFHAQYNQMLPNDPYFGSLWGMNNSNDYDIDAPEAWNLQTGSGVIVAVIDSGVDYTHPDLAANMVAGWDFTTCNQFYSDGSCASPKARDSDPMDDYGHGTHVAGTIAAVGNNGIGVVGVSMNAKIMPIKVLNANGSGSWADIAEGIIYASEHGAHISNNSYGGCCATSYYTIDAAIATARQNGMMLFVAAAANDAVDNDKSPYYPCSSLEPNVICVAATDQNDALASFSNYGATRVDLAAPGTSIFSTVPSSSCPLCNPSGYQYLQGTSMAAPHVAGAAALAMAQFSGYTGDQIKNLLIGSVDPVASLAGKVASGGRLNANNALRPGIAISATPVSVQAGQSVASTITVQSLNNFSGSISLYLSSSEPNITGILSASSLTLNNDSQTVSLTVSSASGMAAGIYPLTIKGTFTNSEGGIETRSGVLIVTVQTDLAITALSSSSSSAQTGGWFTVSDTIQNQGTSLAKGFYVGYYLSTDNAITDTDVRIGIRWIPSLAAGALSTSITDVWVPSELATGNYYFGAIVDDTLQVPDSNTINNSMSANTVSITGSNPAAAVWVNRYHGVDNSDERATEINIDAFGNTIVTGTVCLDGFWCTNNGVTTVKYSPDGNVLWTVTYDTGATDIVVDQAVDSSGNIYIAVATCSGMACTSSPTTAVVIKYDANGNSVWPAPAYYDMASPNALAVDNMGNSYLTGGWGVNGTCSGSGCAMATVKFDVNGNKMWEDRGTNAASFGGLAIAVDGSGNVYVTNNENGGYTTRKYGPNGGAPLWQAYYAGYSWGTPQGLALDAAGNVYVGGSDSAQFPGTELSGFDVTILKYDNNGNQLWARRYDNGAGDIFSSMAVDASGNVYVAATSLNGKGGYAYADYATIKYDTNGNSQWVARFSDSLQEMVSALAIDRSGNVYVTGSACTSSINRCAGKQDYATIKYGSDGHPRWYARYNNVSTDYAYALVADKSGNVFVTGASYNPGTVPNTTRGSDYATVKYSTIPFDNVVPTVPIGLAASAVSTTQINLSWAASTDNVGVTYYIIYRNGIEIASSYVTSFNDAGVESGTNYSYTVAACDEAGNCSAPSEPASVIITDITPPIVTPSLMSGTYGWALNVSLSANEPATIYYTLDGSTPTTASAVYSMAILVNSSMTIKYFAVDTAGNASAVQSQSYTINLPTPGNVVAWGDNTYSQSTVPAGLSGVVALSGGVSHTVALRSDGTVVVWGDNTYGQISIPAGLDNVVAVAAGAYHTLALKNDGTLVAWGMNWSGQTVIPAGLSGVVAIAASGYHSVALKSDGTVVAWGFNSSGQTAVPAGLSGVVAIAAGFESTVALKSDGTVVAWGRNDFGQTTVPAGLNGVVAVAAGTNHTVALKSDGTVVAWGYNAVTAVPKGLNGVKEIAAGGMHTMALKSDGTMVEWGGNLYKVPGGLKGVVAIAAGHYHSLAIAVNKKR